MDVCPIVAYQAAKGITVNNRVQTTIYVADFYETYQIYINFYCSFSFNRLCEVV